MNRWLVPTKGLSPPNIRPQPRSRKPREDTAKTMKILERMLTVFFALAKPASTAAKPRFMKNTRIAASSTQNVSMIMVTSIYFYLPFRLITKDEAPLIHPLRRKSDILTGISSSAAGHFRLERPRQQKRRRSLFRPLRLMGAMLPPERTFVKYFFPFRTTEFFHSGRPDASPRCVFIRSAQEMRRPG